MDKYFNSDIINLIYEFVDDYELLHKKKFKVIIKQIKQIKNKYKTKYMINDINDRTFYFKFELKYCIRKKKIGIFGIDWRDIKQYIKFFNNKYEYTFLRMYIPYGLLINKETNEYTMINRDYKIIGTEKYGHANEFLFNDGSTIWTDSKKLNEKNFILLKNKIKKLIQNKKCINYNYHTFDILGLTLEVLKNH